MKTADDAAREDAERLNRHWDALLRRGETVHPGGPVPEAGADPALIAAVANLHARDDAAPPDAVFAARLWRELMAGAPDRGREPANVSNAHRLGLVAPFPLPRPVLQIAVAAALVLAILGSSWSDQSFFAPFAASSPTVSAREAVATIPALSCLPSPTPAPTMVTGERTPATSPPCDPAR